MVSVLAGAFFIVVVVCDVVVVVGTGFSTTVVHEVRSTEATTSNGVIMISFFIVGVVSFKDESTQVPRPDVFRVKIFRNFESLVVGTRAQFFRFRTTPLRFQDALLEGPRPGPTLAAALFPARNLQAPFRQAAPELEQQ